MAACFCCFRCCWAGTGFQHVPLKELPPVVLDTGHMGNDVVIVKAGRRICGTGGALANGPIVQDKAYFEMKIQSTGVWGIGLATRKANLNCIPMGTDSETWVLREDGTIYHNNQLLHKLGVIPCEGDVVGVTYDHVEFNLYLNGQTLQCPIRGIKGIIYPVFYVDEGAILDVQFNEFYYVPPSGFDKIMFEQSLL
ncbi:SPRY domain-containing protein 7-like [Saccoglossus kowalevskii]|uniref:SPRY domain-containing protein 7 n=1 Tax=Saccoglossus kowalevskii TaxID=10224 RepID=A0ABM0GL53_SACKO|nr:PREDICTED: SPRY domain-containing protein 7-like [Saccoglossus kowalevskii]